MGQLQKRAPRREAFVTDGIAASGGQHLDGPVRSPRARRAIPPPIPPAPTRPTGTIQPVAGGEAREVGRAARRVGLRTAIGRRWRARATDLALDVSGAECTARTPHARWCELQCSMEQVADSIHASVVTRRFRSSRRARSARPSRFKVRARRRARWRLLWSTAEEPQFDHRPWRGSIAERLSSASSATPCRAREVGTAGIEIAQRSVSRPHASPPPELWRDRQQPPHHCARNRVEVSAVMPAATLIDQLQEASWTSAGRSDRSRRSSCRNPRAIAAYPHTRVRRGVPAASRRWSTRAENRDVGNLAIGVTMHREGDASGDPFYETDGPGIPRFYRTGRTALRTSLPAKRRIRHLRSRVFMVLWSPALRVGRVWLGVVDRT